MNCIKELILKAPDGREKRMLAFLPTEQIENNFRNAAERKGIKVIKNRLAMETRTFTEKLVIKCNSKRLGKDITLMVNYERDVEIDEGVVWRAYDVTGTDAEPEIDVYGCLDADNKATTEKLQVVINHADHTIERIKDITIIECF